MEAREKILEFQIKRLADRLAILHSLALDCELESFCHGDLEAARYFEEIQDYALAPDTDTWNFQRKKWRQRSEYKQSIERVKKWLRDAVKAQRMKNKP